MQKPVRLYEVLYVSTLAPDAPLSVVASIAGASRSRNQARDLTGILIFDGMRFCQQLEGDQKELMALVERIREDSRHTSVAILHHGPIEARRFKNFSLAYAPIDDADPLDALERLDGEPAVAAFLELVESLDAHD
ncbi:MAG: BLUF domain-containing protein [Comamonadaceae bacterium]|nr:MAG: BLUF domain-containing protein [Comamonadaceae bacterium]